jgi:hypothetical protein
VYKNEFRGVEFDPYQKTIVLVGRHCHETEKSEAIARRCRSSRLTGWWTQKELSERMEGQGGGEAQGVADQKNKTKNKKNKYIEPLKF